eukprot:TRINITY_DN26008_c0_g3_i1.p1 TRINITY_DN26008_c0_g3~~TRINITY_DN26008_c0_g3_i1.p1  ORF type:complete len:581 (-),score=120.94 TRINITY_DN26008_c0_g3_i1:158-1861(-)
MAPEATAWPFRSSSRGPSPLRRRVLYLFRSSLERRGYAGPALRSRFPSSCAARRAGSPPPPEKGDEGADENVDPAWVRLWEAISNGGSIDLGDEDAMLACERWRRKERGERHGLWTRLAHTLRHSHADWERLTAGIRAGVPASLRGSVWYACSGAAAKRQEAPTSYAELVRLGCELQNEAASVIEVDLPRTGVGELQMAQLRNVLRAFAVRNPQIGYCQSMNFISKTLLLYNDEERTFWILCSLIEDVLPAGLYTPTMSGLRADLAVLDALIGEYLPGLKGHLVRKGIDLSPITMNWFLCLFVNTLPAEQSHRVLDCLIHEGSKILFRAALGILHMRENELLKVGAVVDAYGILRAPFGADSEQDSEAAGAFTDKLFRTMYGLWLQGLSTDSVAQLRAEQVRSIQAEDEAQAARRQAYRNAQAEQAALKAAAAADASAAAGAAAVSEPERPAAAQLELERLRAESFALVDRFPVEASRLGFAERAPEESPRVVASWLARVSGDEVDSRFVHSASRDHMLDSGQGILRADPVALEGEPFATDGDPRGCTATWLCCQRRPQDLKQTYML